MALVGLGLSSEHALELITEIVRDLLPGDRFAVREGPGIRARGCEARCVRLHRGCPCRGAPERDRHHLAAIRGVSEPSGRLRPAGAHRASEGHPDGSTCDRRQPGLRDDADHSQHNGQKVVDVAQAIVDSHLLLLPPLLQPAANPRRPRSRNEPPQPPELAEHAGPPDPPRASTSTSQLIVPTRSILRSSRAAFWRFPGSERTPGDAPVMHEGRGVLE